MLLATVLLAGLLQAAYGSLMTLSGLEYGALGPKEHGLGFATGTFVNRNHLAGFLELSLAAGLGLLVAQLEESGAGASLRSRLRSLLRSLLGAKMLVRLSLAVLVIALVLTRSRMGNVAFFLSLLLGATLALLLMRRPPRSLLLLFLSLLAVDLLILDRLQASGQAVSQRATPSEDPRRERQAGEEPSEAAERGTASPPDGPGTRSFAFRDADRSAVSRATLAATGDYRWLGSGGGTLYAAGKRLGAFWRGAPPDFVAQARAQLGRAGFALQRASFGERVARASEPAAAALLERLGLLEAWCREPAVSARAPKACAVDRQSAPGSAPRRRAGAAPEG